ncbi:MAG: 23S rRNA (adenine(2030)-N(6))-methyltransferase RlmJ [Spirochaetia bacterium]|nr:23S rRNA (adenine(2030)-N(6))-methyltransferase RlmJ [Spirochaetia bacterium]
MLSYRHGFHAANHADVLKHCTLVSMLSLLRTKDTALLYIDTHAGAGAYALHEGYSAMNEEWSGGLERLCSYCSKQGSESIPESIASYLAALEAYGSIRRGDDGMATIPGNAIYPGSPGIAAMLLRPIDRLALFELHPSDFAPLSVLVSADRRITSHNSDGLAGLRALLPPPSRRALILMDPSYELVQDYETLVLALKEALRRFSTGAYAIWYPLLEREEARTLPSRLATLAKKSLDIRLRVRGSFPGERGMSGSGMLVLNPPWLLKEAMEDALPYLAKALGEDGGASFGIVERGLS